MTRLVRPEQSSTRDTVGFLVVLAVVVVAGGWFAFQALTAEDSGPPDPPFAEQVRALPYVEKVETESDRIPGAANATELESWVVLSPEVYSDPVEAADGLAGVTWGYDHSRWTVTGSRASADVMYLGPVDVAPVRWWTESVAALAGADPAAALHCDIRDHALRCEVETSTPDAAVRALAEVDGSRIGPWLDDAGVDEGEVKEFALRIGGRTFTDATRIG